MHEKTPKLMGRSSLSVLFDSRKTRFCVQKTESPSIAMVYLAVFLFRAVGQVAAYSLQTRLISMLLPAALVDDPFVVERELSNKTQV